MEGGPRVMPEKWAPIWCDGRSGSGGARRAPHGLDLTSAVGRLGAGRVCVDLMRQVQWSG